MCDDICNYVAYKDQPETWHGEDSDDWYSGDDANNYWIEGDSWSCPHDQFGESDGNYCVFHTKPEDVPKDVSEDELLVAAIDEAIKAEGQKEGQRKAEFVGATFGELTLDDLPSSSYDVWLRFDHAVFRGSFEMNNTIHQSTSFFGGTFESDARFDDVTFKKNVMFEQVTFEADSQFCRTTFDGNVLFGEITFDKTNFEKATFKNGGRFDGATFNSTARFEEVTFEDISEFKRATFKNHTSFEEARFDDTVWFDDAKFNSLALFRSASFIENVRFIDTIFNSVAVFHGAAFKGICWFEGADFKQKGVFLSATFKDSAHFNDATFEKTVSFAGTSLVDVKIVRSQRWTSTFRKADLTGADLTNVNLANADLEGAKFSRATLYGTDFSGAKLDGTIFGEAQVNERTNFGQFVSVTCGGAKDRISSKKNNDGDGEAAANDKNTLKGDNNLQVEQDDAQATERPLRVVYDPFGCSEETNNKTDCNPVYRLKRMANRYRYWHTTEWLDGKNGHLEVDEASKPESEPTTTDSGTTQVAPHADTHLRKAASTYHLIENLARHNSLPRLQSEAFIRRQEMHRLQYAKKRQFSKWLRASTARATLLFGESPWRVIGASLSVILLFGMLYPLGGLRDPDSGEVIKPTSMGEWLATVPDGIYFSTLTFTTLGFGDFQPVSWGKWLATIETALGATLLALLVFVLGRRAAR